jgi:hypothetical protein
MFLSAVLFFVFLAGCWLYCLADAIRTPAAQFPGAPKPVWITVIAVTFIFGAIAWMAARTARRIWYWSLPAPGQPAPAGDDEVNVGRYPHQPTTVAEELLAAEAQARHPSSQSRNAPGRRVPIGPDDDPEFLRLLAERIRGEQ